MGGQCLDALCFVAYKGPEASELGRVIATSKGLGLSQWLADQLESRRRSYTMRHSFSFCRPPDVHSHHQPQETEPAYQDILTLPK